MVSSEFFVLPAVEKAHRELFHTEPVMIILARLFDVQSCF